MRGMRPLHRDLATADLDNRCHGRNEGLWYDKFCDQWRKNPDKQGPHDWSLEAFQCNRETITPKNYWIKRSTDKVSVGDKGLLEEHHARRLDLLTTGNGEALICRTMERMVSGLGRAHPVENGFAWHHSLGVPALPGSGIKGLVRQWVEQWAADGGADNKDVKRILGSSDDRTPGSVAFLDALPVEPVRLDMEVMTPHFGAWYGDNNEPPGDWLHPSPTPFLAIASGSEWLFGVLPRNHLDEQARNDCQKAARWLGEALEWLGIGAKTSVGYGAMQVNAEKGRQLKEERRQFHEQRLEQARKQRDLKAALAELPDDAAELKERFHERDWTDREAFLHDAEAFLEGRENLSPEALEPLAETMVRLWQGILDDPEAKKGKKKDKFKYPSKRARELAKRLHGFGDRYSSF